MSAVVLLASLLLAVLSPPAAVASSSGAGPARSQQWRPAGQWQWPLRPQPAVVRPFAPGPTRYSAGHYGVDLAASLDQPVLAAGAGRVSYSGLLAGRGVVVVDHGALRTSYEPVEDRAALGAVVGRGALLGRLATGHACPSGRACLHWGLRRGGDYLDPLLLVRRPVRLLPVPAGGPSGGGADRRVAGPGLAPGAAPGAAPVAAAGAASGAGPGSTRRSGPEAFEDARSRSERDGDAPSSGRAEAGPAALRRSSARTPASSEHVPRADEGLTPGDLVQGTVAALALVAGLALVGSRRRGPRPPGPAAPLQPLGQDPSSGAGPPPGPGVAVAPLVGGTAGVPDPPGAALVDLAEERRRRGLG